MTSPDETEPRWSVRLGQAFLRIDLLLGVLVTLAGLVLYAFSGIGDDPRAGFAFLENIEQRSLDLRFGLRGVRPHDDRIVIVGIDEQTLQKIGSFPFPRGRYADLVRRLSADGARVIAFDVTFPTPESNSAIGALQRLESELGRAASPAVRGKIQQLEMASDQDDQLAVAIRQSGRVVLAHLFLSPERAKGADQKLEEEYFNIVWAKNYPQVFPVASKDGRRFDIGQAWIDAGGTVAAGAEANIAKLADAAQSYGFIDINPDPDGTLRHALLAIRYQNQDFFPPLALQVVRQYENIPDQEIALYIAASGLERIQFGRRTVRPAPNGTAIINYAGPYKSYRHHSMWDVLAGSLPPGTFQDKIVLIGATAEAIGDMRNTPFEGGEPYMGVEVHANIIDNVLHSGERGRGFLTRGFDEEMIDIAFVLIFGLLFGFLFSNVRPLYSTLSLLVGLGGFSWFVYWSFAQHGRWLSFVIPAGTLVANYAAITSYRMIFEERQKRKLRKSFAQYLSPGVIALIERDPQKYIRPGGESKELTVLFSDIRGFTTISEALTPDELVRLLNEYLGAMTEILFSTNGTLDKYIGDAIMAFWGSPYPQADHAYQGCLCALEMVRGLAQLNAKWAAEGRCPLSIGVGLNTGRVNVGNMGSAKRLAWTVMGDNVNLASRLEGITKEYQTQIVTSENTYRQVADKFVFRELDKIKVKGKHQPVTIYELLDVISERHQHEALLAEFDHAMDAYRAQDWRQAAERLGQMLATYPDDGPTRLFLQRTLEFMENAPEPDWDGVYVMKSK
jgi:adenylate cyclase